MPTELDKIVSDLTTQIRDLEKQAKAAESKAKDAQARADLAVLDADHRIGETMAATQAKIAEIEAGLTPYTQKQRELADLTARVEATKASMIAETQRLKEERLRCLGELNDQIMAQSNRLNALTKQIVDIKASVASL